MKRGQLLAGSVASRVVEFFRNRPDEELAGEDIRLKWAHDGANVSKRMRGLVNAGILVGRRQNRPGIKGGGTQVIYTAGPALLAELEEKT